MFSDNEPSAEQTECVPRTGLHGYGVFVAAKWLLDRGFALESLARDPKYDPQIIANRGGRQFHFAVRTARWPATAELECDELRAELRMWASCHEAACYLARVSIGGRTHRVSLSRL